MKLKHFQTNKEVYKIEIERLFIIKQYTDLE